MTFYINGFIIYDGLNHKEIISCFGEKEAKYLLKEINKFSSKDHGNLSIEKGAIPLYLDKDYNLDNLEKNLKKL